MKINMNKILEKEYKKLLKEGYDSLSIYLILRKIDDKLTLRQYSDYENKHRNFRKKLK